MEADLEVSDQRVELWGCSAVVDYTSYVSLFVCEVSQGVPRGATI